jgi:DNA-binding protein HU-beta
LFINKIQLIERIALDAGISKAAASRVVKSIIRNIIATNAAGNYVQLIGFGTFRCVHRAPRVGLISATGQKVSIPATKNIKFIAGKFFLRIPLKQEAKK